MPAFLLDAAEAPSLSMPKDPSGLFVLGVVALCIYALIQLLRQYVPMKGKDKDTSGEDIAKVVAAAVGVVVAPLVEKMGEIAERFAVAESDVKRHAEEIERHRARLHEIGNDLQAVSTRQEITERTSPAGQYPAPPRTR